MLHATDSVICTVSCTCISVFIVHTVHVYIHVHLHTCSYSVVTTEDLICILDMNVYFASKVQCAR